MHIKVDEDIPPIAAAWLQERGYEASTVVDQGMGGWQDDPLWQAVQADQQFLRLSFHLFQLMVGKQATY